MSLNTISEVYRALLTPIPPFTWIGSPVSTLDVAAALRLCIVLRQLRDAELKKFHESRIKDEKGTGSRHNEIEHPSLVKSIATVLVVVYGGEAVMNPWLGISPSFVFSPVVPALYSILTVLVEGLPYVPQMSMFTEFPLSLFDGITRSYLLCALIPPPVTTHASLAISQSPWTLILASLVVANAGFLIVGMSSMLHPSGYSLTTPPELRAWGWTTADIWCAPVTTGIYALLTHAQPFWADLHLLLVELARPYAIGGPLEVAKELDAETARSACALALAVLFTGRTVKNFGPAFLKQLRFGRKKTLRPRKLPLFLILNHHSHLVADTKRHNGPKSKTQ